MFNSRFISTPQISKRTKIFLENPFFDDNENNIIKVLLFTIVVTRGTQIVILVLCGMHHLPQQMR